MVGKRIYIKNPNTEEVYQKPKGGKGYGEPIGYNIYDMYQSSYRPQFMGGGAYTNVTNFIYATNFINNIINTIEEWWNTPSAPCNCE